MILWTYLYVGDECITVGDCSDDTEQEVIEGKIKDYDVAVYMYTRSIFM